MSWRRVSVCPCRSSCIFYFFIFRFVDHVSAVSARRIMHLVHLSMLDALWKFELPSSSVPPPTSPSPSSTATRAMHRKRFFEWSEEVKKRNSADRQTHLAYAGDRQLLCREPHCIPFRLTFFYHYFIYHYFAQQSVYIHIWKLRIEVTATAGERTQKTSWFIDMCLLWVIGITCHIMSRATREMR